MLRGLVSVSRGGKVHLWRRHLCQPSKNVKITSIVIRSLWIALVVYEVKGKKVFMVRGKYLSDLEERWELRGKILNRKHIYLLSHKLSFFLEKEILSFTRTTGLSLGKVLSVTNCKEKGQFCSYRIQESYPSLGPALSQGNFYFLTESWG